MKNNEVITFGCRLNTFESEVIKDAVNKSNIDNAIVFNSCAVTKEAERQVMQAIRKAKKNNPEKYIIVTGCAAQLNPGKFAQMPEVNRVLGNEEKLKSDFYNFENEKIIVNDIMSIKETAAHMVSNFDGRARAYVQVQNGCNHRCTFCTIPLARGNSRSVPIGPIVEQAKLLVDKGYNEIVITGVDITDYGLDLPGQPTLGQMVLRLLNLVPDLTRLRISSVDVAEIDPLLMEMIQYEKRVMPHLHISLQAGDNMILKRMKRRHNREQVIEFCHKVRGVRKDFAFGADMIAGFPTETDEMFENSRNLIHEAEISYVHVFPFSERNDTPASRMPQVDKAVRKERANLLRQAGEVELNKLYQNMIGHTVSAIVEKNNVARSENFSLIHLQEDLIPGNIVKVKIEQVQDNKLLGKLV